MKLKDCRENYYFHTGKVSEISRQLAFAGLALIWIFIGLEIQETLAIPNALIWPGILILVTLALDFLHYLTAAAIWGIYGRAKERAGISQSTEFKAPRHLNWPAIVLFILKATAIIIAYILLIRFLAMQFTG